MDKTVPFWIAIVTKSHILSTWLPPWNDWRATEEVFYYKLLGCFFTCIHSVAFWLASCWKKKAPQKKPTYLRTISLFSANLPEIMTWFAYPPQHHLKQPNDCATPLPDHCPWTFIFHLFFSPSLWSFIICFTILHLLTYIATLFPSADVCIRPLS